MVGVSEADEVGEVSEASEAGEAGEAGEVSQVSETRVSEARRFTGQECRCPPDVGAPPEGSPP